MTPLRQRMIEDMQLRGLSARTQECYVGAVHQLAAHHHRSPDELSEEDLREYFLYLTNEKKVARATATIALCGIKFPFGRAETILLLTRPLNPFPRIGALQYPQASSSRPSTLAH